MDETLIPDIPKTILVVDDTPAILQFVSGLLVNHYHVIRATNGPDAIVQADEYRGAIHLLLSDFEMQAMTGIELATKLCGSRPQMKVLLMSGFDGGMLVLNEGWHFLAKPFIPSQLRAIVTTLLDDGLLFSGNSVTGLD